MNDSRVTTSSRSSNCIWSCTAKVEAQANFCAGVWIRHSSLLLACNGNPQTWVETLFLRFATAQRFLHHKSHQACHPEEYAKLKRIPLPRVLKDLSVTKRHTNANLATPRLWVHGKFCKKPLPTCPTLFEPQKQCWHRQIILFMMQSDL